MRILITGTTGESMPPPYGGVPKLCLLMSKVWKSMGHDVGICFVYKPENADDFGAGVHYFFEYSRKPRKIDKLLFLFSYFLRNPYLYTKLLLSYTNLYKRLSFENILYSAYGVYISRLIRKFKPDLLLGEAVLVQTYMAAKVAKLHRVPIVFDSYSEVHNLSMAPNNQLDEEGRRNYWTNFLGLADLVIAPGPHCCRGPKAYLPENKVTYVYDGSDYSLCELDIRGGITELRSELGLPQDQFLIGNVGAFEARKGHDHLIKAIAILAKQGYPVGAVICGGAGDATKWKQLAEAEGVTERVHFFGKLSEMDLARMYKSLDAFSDLENSPRACGLTMAILEGMAMGLPVVIYENKDMLEIVKVGETGFVAPMNDTEALAKEILRMYQLPPDTRRRMGERSSEIAKKIDIDFTAKAKLELFEQLLTKK